MNHSSFLAEIADRPDDDTPRLIYADWLEDNGDLPRAEFIRVQIERTRLDRDDDRQAELEATERRLLLKYADQWVPAELPLSWTEFRRGFPEVLAPMPSWLTDEQMDSLGPLPIRELRLYGGDGELDTGRIREMELLGRIEELRLGSRRQPLAGVEILDLLGSPRLSNLKRLNLAGNGMAPREIDRLLDVPAVGQVEALNLEYNLTEESIPKLVSLPWPNLTQLRHCRYPLGTSGLRALASSAIWPRLQEIYLGILAEDLEEQVLVEALETMTARSLGLMCGDSSQGLSAFSRAVRWGNLERFQLSEDHGNLQEFVRLLEHPAMNRLREFSADVYTRENPLAFECLVQSPRLMNLRRLTLTGVSSVLGQLARSRHLTRLTRIMGGGNEDDMVAFLRSENANRVQWLASSVPMTDRVIEALVGSPSMTRLTTLYAADGLTDRGAELLATSSHLKNLTSLDLHTDQLTASGQQALLEAEHLGWVGIHEDELKTTHLRKLWRKRYGDAERVGIIGDGWTECL